jgi:phage baseplate assembly protein W
MVASTDEIIGAGWTFPLQFSASGGVILSFRDRKLEESMRLILSTGVGERPMRPAFGCTIHDYVFGMADQTTCTDIAMAVRDALGRWEPRVVVVDVDVAPDEDDPALLWIDVRYRAVHTNDPRNLVFPFYTIPVEPSTP